MVWCYLVYLVHIYSDLGLVEKSRSKLSLVCYKYRLQYIIMVESISTLHISIPLVKTSQDLESLL